MKRIYVAIVGFAAVLTAAGVIVVIGGSAIASSTQGPPPDQLSAARGPIAPISGSAAAEAARIATGINGIANPRFTGGTNTSGSEVAFDVAVPSFTGGATAEAMWKADIYAGALADSLAASNLPLLTNIDATLVRPDGARDDIGGGVGNVVSDQRFEDVTPSVIAGVHSRVDQLGLGSTQISIARGLQDAVIVVLTSQNPNAAVATLRSKGGLDWIFGSATAYEGEFLDVRDAAGDIVYVDGMASRDGAHVMWARPDLGIQVGLGTPPLKP